MGSEFTIGGVGESGDRGAKGVVCGGGKSVHQRRGRAQQVSEGGHHSTSNN